MGPKTVIEGEVMLFFIFLFVFVEDGGILFHVHTTNTSEELLALIERTYSNGNFDAHYI